MGEAKEARQQVRKCAIKTNDPLGSERFDWLLRISEDATAS
jgi:hypothetical protein